MNVEQFEQAYDLLAQAVDRAGPDGDRQLLARLALALAHRVADLESFRAALVEAEAAADPVPGKKP